MQKVEIRTKPDALRRFEKKLRPVEFKRYCGVKPKTFERMVAVVNAHQDKMRRKLIAGLYNFELNLDS